MASRDFGCVDDFVSADLGSGCGWAGIDENGDEVSVSIFQIVFGAREEADADDGVIFSWPCSLQDAEVTATPDWKATPATSKWDTTSRPMKEMDLLFLIFDVTWAMSWFYQYQSGKWPSISNPE